MVFYKIKSTHSKRKNHFPPISMGKGYSTPVRVSSDIRTSTMPIEPLFPQFSLLPLEIQLHILKQNRETLVNSLRLSKAHFKLVGKELCFSYTITRKLLQKYLNEQTPRIFGVEMTNNDISWYIIFTLVCETRNEDYEPHWVGESLGIDDADRETVGGSIKDTFKIHVLKPTFTIDSILNYVFDGKSELDLDLLTWYRILSKLPTCVDHLPSMVHSWKQWYIEGDIFDELEFSEDKFHIFPWYTYLVTMYTSVFNLGPEILNRYGSVKLSHTIENGKRLFDERTLNKIDDMKRDFDILRQKIPKFFDILHLYA